MKLSELIKQYRQFWGLTQEQFAHAFDFNLRSVQRWERGRVLPRPIYRQKLFALCEKPMEDQMKRRTFLHTLVSRSLPFAVSSQIPSLLQSMEHLSSPRAHSSVEEELILVEILTKTHWQLLPHTANVVNSDHLHDVQGYRQLLTSWSSSSPNTSVTSRLVEAIGESAQIEAILLYALGHLNDAETSYRSAIKLAHEADNVLLEANGLAWYGNFLIDTGRVERAEAPLDAASEKARRGGASPTMSAWIAASKADAWARRKEGYKCEVALARAETYMYKASGQDPYPVPYDRAWSLGYKGACYVHSGRVQEAKATLEQGLQLLGTGIHRQADLYKNFAIAYSLEKDVEAACSSTRRAMQIAKDANAPMELQDAQDAMREFLKPWKDHALVKDIAEEFRAVQQGLAPL